MKPLFVWISLAVLLSARPASAHRLDEYLQATTFRLEPETIHIKLRLTPGVSVYQKIAARIDADGDGEFSPSEKRDYAGEVRRDLTLFIDGIPVPLRSDSWTYPAADEMSAGIGEIVIDLQARLPAGKGERTLRFENHHEAAIGVYLVNCLVPGDPSIAIQFQRRSYDQSKYELGFSIAALASAVKASPNAENPSGRWVDRAEGWPAARAFFFQGVRHILTGYDHLLFVGALVMAAASFWDLVKVVTAFTAAHTITLALATLNLVHVSPLIVEPLISASIVFVALQNLVRPGRAGAWSRLLPAFFFGLFHGLGFAGGLLEDMRGLPRGSVLIAIVGFSLGVEVGHQMVVLPLFAALQKVRQRRRVRFDSDLRRLGSLAIAACGLYFLCTALVATSS